VLDPDGHNIEAVCRGVGPALPLIVTHGWRGSPIEQLKIIDPLTDPTAHGGSASDAFHVVIPSMQLRTTREPATA